MHHHSSWFCFSEYPVEESNLVQLFRRQLCDHHTHRARITRRRLASKRGEEGQRGTGGSRTHALLLNRQTLLPLSYRPKKITIGELKKALNKFHSEKTNAAQFRSDVSGGRTHKIRRSELRRFSVCVPRQSFQVARAGIEPASKRSKRPILPLDDLAISVPRRGIEPRPTVSKTAMLPTHPQGSSFFVGCTFSPTSSAGGNRTHKFRRS